MKKLFSAILATCVFALVSFAQAPAACPKDCDKPCCKGKEMKSCPMAGHKCDNADCAKDKPCEKCAEAKKCTEMKKCEMKKCGDMKKCEMPACGDAACTKDKPCAKCAEACKEKCADACKDKCDLKAHKATKGEKQCKMKSCTPEHLCKGCQKKADKAAMEAKETK